MNTLILFLTVPIVLLIAEKPFGLITRLRNQANQIYFWERVSAYQLFSYFMLTGIWVFFLMYLPQVLHDFTNPLLAFYLNGHWLSWLGLTAIITVYGVFDIIRGLYVAAYVYALHEIIWITLMGLVVNNILLLYTHFLPALIVMFVLLISYFFAFRFLPRKKEILVLIIILTFNFLWLAAGFHVTTMNWNSNPKTQYFNDPTVNLVEVLSWIFPALVTITSQQSATTDKTSGLGW